MELLFHTILNSHNGKNKRKELQKAKKPPKRTIRIGTGRRKTGRNDKYFSGSTRDAHSRYLKDHPKKPIVRNK